MRTRLTIAGSILALAATAASGPAAAQPPRKVGACAQTVITRIGTRFGGRLVKPKSDLADSGTSVEMRNGVYGVSYSYQPEVARSRVGDRVLTCLVSLPKDCPKGDERGKIYTTTNLRTQESWTLPDAQHMCGGA